MAISIQKIRLSMRDRIVGIPSTSMGQDKAAYLSRFFILLYCFSFPMIISNWSAFTQLEATLVIRSKSVNEPLKNSKNWLWLAVRSREEEAPRKKL